MLERVAVEIGLVAVVVGFALAIRMLARQRVAAAEGENLPAELQARLPERAPGIVYFFGPHCGSCRQQASILDRLSSDEGVAVVRVDATRETALADRLAVTTVPATVIVDSRYQVHAINLGLQSRDALDAQLREIGASRPA